MTKPDIEYVPIELDLTWVAEFVEPGTPSDDGWGQEMPPGWWIFGVNPDGNREAQMHVPEICNVRGVDVSKQAAQMLADRLNRAGDPRG